MWNNEAPLRVNPEQAPAFRPGCRRVDTWSKRKLRERWVVRIERASPFLPSRLLKEGRRMNFI